MQVIDVDAVYAQPAQTCVACHLNARRIGIQSSGLGRRAEDETELRSYFHLGPPDLGHLPDDLFAPAIRIQVGCVDVGVAEIESHQQRRATASRAGA